ncbi:MAG TPA: HAD family hydrolase, partial [Pelolinea sp.]|nr:HAD family hydrolase [Pelolinea sp.]
MNKQYNLSDYKLIVFDIDGTLVGSSHQLNTTTKEILLRLHQIGMPFTLATGKILPATRDQADELQIKLPLILSNGGVVQTRKGEILFHST